MRLRSATGLRGQDLFQLVEDATHLGSPGRRLPLVAVAVSLAAAATAAGGPVALVAPHIALRLAATPGPPIAASAAAGVLLVVAADLAARTGLPALGLSDTQLPVGAVTALVGAPVLLLLLPLHLRENHMIVLADPPAKQCREQSRLRAERVLYRYDGDRGVDVRIRGVADRSRGRHRG